MDTSATNSALDVAYWFIYRAEKENMHLETEKLHYLLFVSQYDFAKRYPDTMLMPCVFLCDEYGFFEPTLKKMFSQGRPFMPPVSLNVKLSDFLENIWQKNKLISLSQCRETMIKLPLYHSCYLKDHSAVVTWSILKNSILDSAFTSNSQPAFRKKILVSQNGPVVVSQWAPRKITL
jgi:hypothetical protein